MAELTWKNISAPSLSGAAAMSGVANRQLNKSLSGISNWMDERVTEGTKENTDPILSAIGSATSLGDLESLENQYTPEALSKINGGYVDKAGIANAFAKQKGILADKAGADLLGKVQGQIAEGKDTRSILNSVGTEIQNLTPHIGMDKANSILNLVQSNVKTGKAPTAEESRARKANALMTQLTATQAMKEQGQLFDTALSEQTAIKKHYDPYFAMPKPIEQEVENAGGAAGYIYKDKTEEDAFLGLDANIDYTSERKALNEGIDSLYKRFSKGSDGVPALSRAQLHALAVNVAKEKGAFSSKPGFFKRTPVKPKDILSRVEDLISTDYKSYHNAESNINTLGKQRKAQENKLMRQIIKAQVEASL